jgi:cytidylate kinase
MDNYLVHYLNKRLYQNDPVLSDANHQPGPVICISREVGCGALNLAGLLAQELDKLGSGKKKWKVASKEILSESARELDMNPDKLKNYLNDGDRGVIDDILSALSEKRFKSDRRISKTLIDLIRTFANEGYCIIVGRAGHIIAKDIEHSLLVKLTAPSEWRINQIMNKNKLDHKGAVEFIEKTGKERENFRKHIAVDKNVNEEFDMTINLSRLDTEKTISLICHAAQINGLIEPVKNK